MAPVGEVVEMSFKLKRKRTMRESLIISWHDFSAYFYRPTLSVIGKCINNTVPHALVILIKELKQFVGPTHVKLFTSTICTCLWVFLILI